MMTYHIPPPKFLITNTHIKRKKGMCTKTKWNIKMRVGTGIVGQHECKMGTISHVAEASGGSASSSASDSTS